MQVARGIAERLGVNVDPTAITRIEQQTRAVRLDEAIAIAETLNVPLLALISESPAESSQHAIEEHVAELTRLQRQWETTRREIQRLQRIIATLTLNAEPPVED